MTSLLRKRPLSESPIGKGIPIVGVALGSPTLIHVNPAGSYERHVVRIYASNPTAGDVLLNLLYGELAATSLIVVTIPLKAGLFALIPEMVLKSTQATAGRIGAYVAGADASKIIVFGDIDIEEGVPD